MFTKGRGTEYIGSSHVRCDRGPQRYKIWKGPTDNPFTQGLEFLLLQMSILMHFYVFVYNYSSSSTLQQNTGPDY